MTFRLFVALFVAILFVAGSARATPADADDFTIHVFGDSLSDNGNLYTLTSGAIPPFPPYINGRFSNGPVWVEYLAPMLVEAPDVTILDDNAFGGAFSDSRNHFGDLLGLELPGLQDQVANFVSDGGCSGANELTVVWAGANNYIFEPTVSVPLFVVKDVTDAIEQLVMAGCVRFLVPNLPNIGETPFADSRPFLTPVLTAKIAQHNAQLAVALANLSESLDIEIVQFDVASLFHQAVAGTTGFTKTNDSCIEFLSELPSCDGFLFFDDVHPTTEAHRDFATAAFGAITALQASKIAAAE